MKTENGTEVNLIMPDHFFEVYTSFLTKLLDQLTDFKKLDLDVSQFKDLSPWFHVLLERGWEADLAYGPITAFVPFWHMPPLEKSLYTLLQVGNSLNHTERNRGALAERVIGLGIYSSVRQDRDPVIDGGLKVGVAIDAEILADVLNRYYSEFLSLDYHSSEAAGYIQIPHLNITAAPEFAKNIQDRIQTGELAKEEICLVALDKGSLQRVLHVAKILDLDLETQILVLNKERTGHQEIKHSNILWGNPEGKHCIIIDDLIDTGSSIIKTCEALKQSGVLSISVMATHGILSLPARENIQNAVNDNLINKLVMTDSTKFGAFKLINVDGVETISMAPIIAAFIRLLSKFTTKEILMDSKVMEESEFAYLLPYILQIRNKELVWSEFEQLVNKNEQSNNQFLTMA